MLSPTVSPTTHLAVFCSLVVLTAATVGVSFLQLSATWHFRLGMMIATAKAALVLWFFMQVVSSPALIRAVLVVALFWLFGVLMVLAFTDYGTRSLSNRAVAPLPIGEMRGTA